MPLQEQKITIPLVGGVNQGIDEKIAPAGTLTDLENARVTKSGKLVKRNGYTALSTLVYDDQVDVSEARGLIVKDGRLFLIGSDVVSGPRLYEWRADDSEWERACFFDPVNVTLRYDVVPNENILYYDVESPGIAVSGDVICYVFMNGGTAYAVRVDSVGTVSSFEAVSSSCDYIKIARFSDGFCAAVVDSTGNTVKTYQQTGSGSFLLKATYSIHSSQDYVDLCDVDDDRVALVYSQPSGPNYPQVRVLNRTGTWSSSVVEWAATPTGSYGIARIYDGGEGIDRICIAYMDSTSLYLTAISTDSLTIIQSHVSVVSSFTIWTFTPSRIVVAPNGSISPFSIKIFVSGQITGAVEPDHYLTFFKDVELIFLTPSGSVQKWAGYIVASKAYLRHGIPYLWMLYEAGDGQSYYGLFAFSGDSSVDSIEMVARALYGKGVPFAHLSDGDHRVSNMAELDDGSILSALTQEGKVISTEGSASPTDYSYRRQVVGVKVSFLSFLPPSCIADGKQVFAGGFISEFRGAALLENGFHNIPNIVGINTQVGAVSGDFVFKILYEYNREDGSLERSSPSLAFSYSASGEDYFDVYHLGLNSISSKKINSALPVIYRTIDGGNTYYRVTSFQDAGRGYIPSPQILLSDPDDTEIQNNEQIYTIGGEVENVPPSSCVAIAYSDKRILAVEAENPTIVWASKQKRVGLGFEFSDLLKRVSTEGNITALAVLNNNKIIFTATSICYFVGDGPTNNGIGSFSPDTIISRKAGNVSGSKVIETRIGLIFKDAKSFMLLSPDLSLTDIGQSIRNYKDNIIIDGVILDDEDQVALALDDDETVLLFDYRNRAWSEYKNHTDIAALTKYNSGLAWAASDGQVYTQSGGYLDDATEIQMRVKTAWLNLAGINGYKRIWKALLLGESINNHTLDVKIYYDFDDTVAQTISIVNPAYPIDIRPKKQLCSSIRFEFTDGNGSGTYENLSLNGMTLVVGTARGTARLPQGRRAQ